MADQTAHADFLIVGAGIAGASIAYRLAPHGRVVLLEAEAQPGYHTTGRSAALFLDSYGPPQVRALTRASRTFFEHPPKGFAENPLLSQRGAMVVAAPGQEAQLEGHWLTLQAMGAPSQRLSAEAALRKVPVLRAGRVVGAVLEPDAADMDVHAIHQGYLRGLRSAAGELVCDAPVRSLSHDGKIWWVEAGERVFTSSVVVNAAGAWVDEVAQMAGVHPLGIEPRRRSAFVFAAPPGLEVAHWPAVIGAGEDWYIKPDAGMLLGSPANADLTHPHDVQPEELDIAQAIDRIETNTTLTIRRPTRTWAGLRSFVPDGDLIGGFEPSAPGFFWLAALGGYGIQTSAAMGEACAALARRQPIPAHLARHGITEKLLARRSGLNVT